VRNVGDGEFGGMLEVGGHADGMRGLKNICNWEDLCTVVCVEYSHCCMIQCQSATPGNGMFHHSLAS
jgi:hypothetical protein